VIDPTQLGQVVEERKTEREVVHHTQEQVPVLVVVVYKNLIEDHHLPGGMELEVELDYIVEVVGRGPGRQREVVGNLMEELELLGFAISSGGVEQMRREEI